MKILTLLFIFFTSLSLAGNADCNTFIPADSKTMVITSTDSVIFDLVHSTITPTYIDVPVLFKSDDAVDALDFAFKFDETKLTYDSIINFKAYLLSSAHFNTIDRFLRFTSSSFITIENNTKLVSIRFFLATPCSTITSTDFNSVVVYLNGDSCSYKIKGQAHFETTGYYYRSLSSGNWNTGSTWEASSTGTGGWVTTCTPPTGASAGITIQNGHTVIIDTIAIAPDLTINAGGSLISANTRFTSLTISGNLINNGTFQMVNGLYGTNVIFNKNGNQSVTGSGPITNFYSIGLNMGTSRNNILDISPSNFSCSRSVLFNSSDINVLLNGTIKFSGSYTFTGKLFKTGLSYLIASSAGVWINNPNVVISASDDSYNVAGLLKISAGVFNAGTVPSNAIRLSTGASMIVDGGIVNVSGRIQATNSTETDQPGVSYKQTGGTVNLTVAGSNTHASIADFYLPLSSDTLRMSGGKMVFRNVATAASDLLNYATAYISGGMVQFSDSLSDATTLKYEIESGSALPSLYIFKPLTMNTYVHLGDNLKIVGNVNISNGTTLDNLYVSSIKYNISLTGDWINNGTFLNNNLRTVTFNGNSSQRVSGVTNTVFNNLTINNSSGGLMLLSPASVNALLTFINGNIFTSSVNLLTLNTAASVTGASNSGFVSGPVSKVGNSDFIFPVGKDLEYRPVSTTALTGSETFTAEYFHTDPDALYSRYSKDSTLDHLDGCEYWTLNRAGTMNANVTLSWDTYSCGVTSLPDLRVARWDPGVGVWKDQGNGGTTGASSAGTIASNGLMTSFNAVTLASNLVFNPLPIELLSFEADYNGSGTVDLKWVTASETNNDYFAIERSADAEHFIELTKVIAAGNTKETNNYITTDDSPIKGISYYRLKQTDFNGAYSYSNIVSVNIDHDIFQILNVFNNETDNMLELTVHSNQTVVSAIQLIDMTGKIMYSSASTISPDNSKLIIPTSALCKGIYLLRLVYGDQFISRKIKL